MDGEPILPAYDRSWLTTSLQKARQALEHRQQECHTHKKSVDREQHDILSFQHTPTTPIRTTISHLEPLTTHCNARSARLERYGWHGHDIDLASTTAANATETCGMETAAWYIKRTLAKTARDLWDCEENIAAEEDDLSDVLANLLEVQGELVANEQSRRLVLRNFHVGQMEKLLVPVAGRKGRVDTGFLERVQALNDVSVDCRVYVGDHERSVHEFM